MKYLILIAVLLCGCGQKLKDTWKCGEHNIMIEHPDGTYLCADNVDQVINWTWNGEAK